MYYTKKNKYYFSKAFEIIKLDTSAINDIANDPEAIKIGLYITSVGGMLGFAKTNSFSMIIFGAFYSIFVLFLFTAIIHLLCGYTKDKKEFMAFARIIALGNLIDWLAIFPILNIFTTIWSGGIAIFALNNVYGINKSRAILVIITALFILLLFIGMILTGPLSFLLPDLLNIQQGQLEQISGNR